MNNKRGFTLVEILAVLVVLAIIVLLALNKIKGSMKKTNEKTYIANAQVFIKAVNDAASTSRLTGKFEDGFYPVSTIFSQGVDISGTKPTKGYINISDGNVASGCLEYDTVSVNINGGELTYANTACIIEVNLAYEYTGEMKEFKVNFAGIYKLEVWGAKGGYRSSEVNGGNGGYSSGEIHLNSGDVLYINVGSSGNNGGYNGGGVRTTYSGGGGASDIRIEGTSLYHRILVAGGGGSDGAARYAGGYGGGLSGQSVSAGCGSGGGGASQTSGAGFGVGGTGVAANGGYGGGGGGGWYGGYGGSPDCCGDDDRPGGGGSGFAYDGTNTVPTDYAVSEHVLTNTQVLAGNESIPTFDGEGFMTGNGSDGYARITLIEAD